MLRTLAVVPLLALLPVATPAPPAPPGSPGAWTWPLDGPELDRGFEAPASAYGPGHRGIDVGGTAGDTVRAVAPGRVSVAGRVAGVAVVTVDHGGERSTYQPVAAVVEVGDAVAAGQPIGRLLASPSHCAVPCLHLGRRAGDTYLDPLDLLGSGARFRLVSPDGPPPPPPPVAGGSGALRRPVGGPVTSPFGLRVHPVTGVRKQHDGTDFGAACGTPVRASADGVVTTVGSHRAYGTRVVLRHGGGLDTSYNHLSRASVRVGARVATGDVVGRVGSTGLSTGCHLHFMVVRDGRPDDPQRHL